MQLIEQKIYIAKWMGWDVWEMRTLPDVWMYRKTPDAPSWRLDKWCPEKDRNKWPELWKKMKNTNIHIKENKYNVFGMYMNRLDMVSNIHSFDGIYYLHTTPEKDSWEHLNDTLLYLEELQKEGK